MSLAPPTICRILIVLLLVSGCATARYQPPTMVSDAERKACEEFADTQAASVKGLFSTTPEDWGSAIGSFGIYLPFIITNRLLQNSIERQAAYDDAMEACLTPVVVEQTVTPGDTDGAKVLHMRGYYLATRGRYAEAEKLYKRALAIREQALGEEHPDVVETLRDYAALLRKMDREAEAEEMLARAEVIRAKLMQQY